MSEISTSRSLTLTGSPEADERPMAKSRTDAEALCLKILQSQVIRLLDDQLSHQTRLLQSDLLAERWHPDSIDEAVNELNEQYELDRAFAILEVERLFDTLGPPLLPKRKEIGPC
jgi:hypothetical protein